MPTNIETSYPVDAGITLLKLTNQQQVKSRLTNKEQINFGRIKQYLNSNIKYAYCTVLWRK